MTNINVEKSSSVVIEKHHHLPPTTWKTYFSFSHDHKVIGIQYLVTSFIFLLVGGIFAMIMRGELLTPQSDLVDRTVYNGLFTMHGTVMLFGWTFPSLHEFTRVKLYNVLWYKLQVSSCKRVLLQQWLHKSLNHDMEMLVVAIKSGNQRFCI
ncbi:Heme/copper-type cytochrome/quinol oxidases, subunit 1 [Dulcicalothrix desertica PCC 7102]|nr:Heme/copper-type cytochrome/quinol oxidases, subunit 1 [Dulcicalothrix desertica PCC 7102]